MKKDGLRVTSHDYEWHPKHYGVITGLFCGLYMITMTLTPKLIVLYGFIFPAGIITFPLCCIITDLLTEVYGFNRTRKAVWTVLVCVILFGAFTQLAILLPPADFWPHQEGFKGIFSTSLRLSAAGCLAWVVGELSNSFVLAKMKILQKAKNMPARFIGSTVVGQCLDTLAFCLIAFSGTMPWKDFAILVLSAWGFKVLYEIVALPLSIPVTKWVKQLEGIEHFDRQKVSVI